MKLVTAATMREMDRHTIDTIGIPGVVLMESAGLAVADEAQAMLRESGRDSAWIICGPGNNGGDGFVAARHLADRGIRTTVVLLGSSTRLSGDAAIFFRALSAMGVHVVEAADSFPSDDMAAACPGLVVDAIFGTGLSRPLDGIFASAVQAANALPCQRLAVDLPSGIESDSGRVPGPAFKADRTVTFACAKISHFVHPAAAFCGVVRVAPIGIPVHVIENSSDARCTTIDDIRAAFPPRDQGDFKNRFGHLAVFGGLRGKSGAGLLACQAAVRCGAGLVTLATDRGTASFLEGRFPDLMIESPMEINANELQFDAEGMQKALSGKSAIVVGPGLSTLPGSDSLLSLIRDLPLPAVLDADALNILAQRPLKHRHLGPDMVLTPHPGEAARLLETTSAEVQADRVAAVRKLASLTGSVVVLKGAGTLVAGPNDVLAVCPAGSPALATAGTGDVLAGMTGAMLARGVGPFQAACAAVHLHALAGELGQARFTQHGLAASDLVDLIPVVLSGIVLPRAT